MSGSASELRGLMKIVEMSGRGCTIHAMTEPRDPAPEPNAELPLYSAENLPNSGWRTFKKVAVTRAMRMEGAFRVQTSESENEPFLCEDGWLAIDARGYPYAIAADEFAQIYAEVPPAAEGEQRPIETRIAIPLSEAEDERRYRALIEAELAHARTRLLEARGLEDEAPAEPAVS